MKHLKVLFAVMVGVGMVAMTVPAVEARTQTYQVHCIASPLGEVTGNLYGFVTMANGNVYLVNLWCHSGQNGDVSVDPRPVIPSSDGKVERIDTINRVYLRLPTGQKLRVHPGGSSNGFLSTTMFYDAANKEGEVISTIDIGNN